MYICLALGIARNRKKQMPLTLEVLNFQRIRAVTLGRTCQMCRDSPQESCPTVIRMRRNLPLLPALGIEPRALHTKHRLSHLAVSAARNATFL